MAINWVGFRASPKPPAGAERCVHELVLRVSTPLSEVVPLFTSSAGLSSWLDSVTAIDARQGGALTFRDAAGESYGGAFAQLNVPKRVLLVTEALGAIEVGIQPGKSVAGQSELRISFTRYLQPHEQDAWLEQVAKRVAALSCLVVRADD